MALPKETEEGLKEASPDFRKHLKKMTGSSWKQKLTRKGDKLEVKFTSTKQASDVSEPTLLLTLDYNPSLDTYSVREGYTNGEGKVEKTREVKDLDLGTVLDPSKILAGILQFVPTKKKVKVKGAETKKMVKAAKKLAHEDLDEAVEPSDLKPGTLLINNSSKSQVWWYKVTGEPFKNGSYPALQVTLDAGSNRPSKAVQRKISKEEFYQLQVTIAKELPPAVRAKFGLNEGLEESRTPVPVGTRRFRKGKEYIKTANGWTVSSKKARYKSNAWMTGGRRPKSARVDESLTEGVRIKKPNSKGQITVEVPAKEYDQLASELPKELSITWAENPSGKYKLGTFTPSGSSKLSVAKIKSAAKNAGLITWSEAVEDEGMTLEEAKALPVGTERDRGGKTYVKTAKGWVYKAKAKGHTFKKGTKLPPGSKKPLPAKAKAKLGKKAAPTKTTKKASKKERLNDLRSAQDLAFKGKHKAAKTLFAKHGIQYMAKKKKEKAADKPKSNDADTKTKNLGAGKPEKGDDKTKHLGAPASDNKEKAKDTINLPAVPKHKNSKLDKLKGAIQKLRKIASKYV